MIITSDRTNSWYNP